METLSISSQSCLVDRILQTLVFGLVLLSAWGTLPQVLTHVAVANEPTLARVESSANDHSAANFRQELQRLVERDASTRELLDWLKRAYDARELAAVALPHQLPWTTWNAPGWRLELWGRRGEHLILASDAGALVAIRQGRAIEMSAMDLIEPSGSNRRSRYATGASTHHVTAASANNLAAKSAYLAPLYFYFAGPTPEVLPSQALPPPAIQLIR